MAPVCKSVVSFYIVWRCILHAERELRVKPLAKQQNKKHEKQKEITQVINDGFNQVLLIKQANLKGECYSCLEGILYFTMFKRILTMTVVLRYFSLLLNSFFTNIPLYRC